MKYVEVPATLSYNLVELFIPWYHMHQQDQKHLLI